MSTGPYRHKLTTITAGRLARVRRVLAALQAITIENPQHQTTLAELAAATGISISTTRCAIRELRDEFGYVTFEDRAIGTIRLVEQY